MALYAYIRKDYPVSTLEQIDMLRAYECQEVFIEDMDVTDNSELTRLLKKLVANDELLVYNLQVFAKKSREFEELLKVLNEYNVRLISIQDHIDTKVSTRFYTDVLKVLKMEERHQSYLIRTSIERAKKQGRSTGRPRVGDQTIDQIVFLFEQKGKSMREIAEICEVSLGTVHKYVNQKKHG